MVVRLGILRKKVEELGYDAYLATDAMDIRYLTGIPVPQEQFLLVKADGNHVLHVMSDGLRTATSKVGNECEIKVAETATAQSTLDLFLGQLPGMGLRRVGFDTLSADVYLKLTEKARGTALVPDRATMWAMRMIKSKDEIEDIRRAVKIADEGHRVAAQTIRPGMREYELMAEVVHAMRAMGSEDEGHRMYVTSGPRTVLGVASGHTTDRKIAEGDFVVADLGATVNGYRSDVCRTYVASNPTAKQKQIYNLLRKASTAALECVKPGIEACEVDTAARKVFVENAKWFNHEAGHGVGLSLPEPPFLVKNSKQTLKESMTVTVEPGLYIDGFGGMCIEDTVLVVKDGAERLSAPPLDWN